ncbi:hypothetical protein EDB19DRAFT_1897639 [Suillus lakei]|nr:hypothetical protein EDB19DRAFT_1897639 [Suillus lakei]
MDLGDAGAMDFGDNDNPTQPMVAFFGTGDWLYRNYHPFSHPCDPEGNFLPLGTPPPPLTDKTPDDWTPYKSQVEFEFADYLFTKNQTTTHSINHLLNMWAASLIQAGSKATLFSDHRHIYKTINNTPLGDVKWQLFTVKYTGEIPEEGAVPWMADSHEVWFCDPHEVVHNMLANPDFAAEMDLQPYHEFMTENDKRQWKDFMSGDWAYNQADMISEDTDTHGSTFVPVILGSDKTTVSNLKLGMMMPEVAHFGDGHYCHVIYGLGPYIADYEEQVLLACIVQRWCAKDRCLSHRKTLNEINLPCSRLHIDALIEEWIIQGSFSCMDVVCAFRAFLEFCYLVCHNILTEKSLEEIQDTLTCFHRYHKIFKTTGTIPTFSLPRQHSMTHYIHCIRLFDAPNGLCSSITESKHIKAVKEPWRRSSQYNTLGQMLLTNQCLDKLGASCVDFCTHGMLSGTCLSSVLAALDVIADSEDIDAPTSVLTHTILALANELAIPHLVDLVWDFLIEQMYPGMILAAIPKSIMDYHCYEGRIQIFNFAVSMFFAPSDLSGIGGMKCEHICVSPNWRNGHACKDCMFVITDPNAHGMQGMDIAQTGLWMVEPSSIDNHAHFVVIHVKSIFRSAHLIPVYGTELLPAVIKSHHILNIFTLFYVNKYADHHAFEIAS